MFVCFIASAIAALPFSMSDEVLFVTYHLNRIISLCDWPTPESLLEKCEQIENTGVKGTSSSHIQNELCRNVELCMHVSIFLKLKHHLKGVYGLADNRMRSYSPSEPPKSGDSFRYDGTFGQLDLSWVDNSLGDTVDGVRRQVELFRSLLQSDSNDYAECLSNDACREHESRKRGRGF
jgi:cohesin loading factor subunit SCC2